MPHRITVIAARKTSISSVLMEMSAPIIAGIVAVPVAFIALHLFSAQSAQLWQHLADTVLTDYITTSIGLMLGVGVLSIALGVPSAWFVATFDFPGRRIFSWALLLPLAFPAYIIAYTYTGVLDYPGPVQSWIREITGLGYGEYWFFEIRSLGGAITMLGLVLYPYVYLLSRAAFLECTAATFEVSRTLGYGYQRTFMRLGVPMARPAIVTGVSLALMETLADFGTVQYFGLSTFTTGIFRTFYAFDDLAAAFQLSAMLLLFVVFLIVVERYSRRKIRYHGNGGQSMHHARIRLSGWPSFAAWVCCFAPIFFGFALPAAILLKWAALDAQPSGTPFGLLVWHSFSLALTAAVVAVLLALLLAYTQRIRNSNIVRSSISVAGLGYAIPGTIVAIGVAVPLAWADRQIIEFCRSVLGAELGLVLTGSIVALVFAYTVRFLAISLGTVQSGLEKIRPSYDDAARSLGKKSMAVLKQIHVPLMTSTVFTALLIVFVDVLKELPATLILRPFNYNTLAVNAYELASDERLTDAALPSLMIIAVGIVPVIALNALIAKGGKHSA